MFNGAGATLPLRSSNEARDREEAQISSRACCSSLDVIYFHRKYIDTDGRVKTPGAAERLSRVTLEWEHGASGNP